MGRGIGILLALALAVGVAVTPSDAHAGKVRTHRVRKGQLLGSIARMYGVPLAAICKANRINCQKPMIKIGQKLRIPPSDDPTGSKTLARKADRPSRGSSGRAASSGKASPQGWHVVRKGQLLGSIANMYGVSTEAMCRANGINCRKPLIRPKQKLIIPNAADRDGKQAATARKKGWSGPTGGGAGAGTASSGSSRSLGKRGYISIVRGDRKWKGYAVRGRSVSGAAKRGFKTVLATRDGRTKTINPRLIELLTKVSEKFGKPIEVVSGYRTSKAGKGSRHRHGRAVDFRIPGVPIKKVLAYCKTFSKVGVGYYPKSGFVHLDVRDQWTHWIDYAGPGQPARYGGFWTR